LSPTSPPRPASTTSISRGSRSSTAHRSDSFVNAWDDRCTSSSRNAGVLQLPELTLIPDGHELHFAINHLGHFALALGLHPALAAAGNARIVSLTSIAHLRSPVAFDDMTSRPGPYDPRLAYGRSKTANILFALEATRRWATDGITANAVHPACAATGSASSATGAAGCGALPGLVGKH
jgi:NAD(P)-dependent dehydrogenase (short-subunit alcohol dehydrogenase family)